MYTSGFQSSKVVKLLTKVITKPSVTWEYNGRPLSQEASTFDHYSYSDIGTEHKLEVYSVQHADEGMYCARGNNEFGQAKSCAKLTLVEAPPDRSSLDNDHPAAKPDPEPEQPDSSSTAPYFHIDIQTCEVNEGEPACFQGQVSNDPPVDSVTWSRDGVLLEEETTTSSGDLKYYFEYRTADGYCALVVVEVEDADEGLYSVAAKNDFGVAQSDALLFLKGKFSLTNGMISSFYR